MAHDVQVVEPLEPLLDANAIAAGKKVEIHPAQKADTLPSDAKGGLQIALNSWNRTR